MIWVPSTRKSVDLSAKPEMCLNTPAQILNTPAQRPIIFFPTINSGDLSMEIFFEPFVMKGYHHPCVIRSK